METGFDRGSIVQNLDMIQHSTASFMTPVMSFGCLQELSQDDCEKRLVRTSIHRCFAKAGFAKTPGINICLFELILWEGSM